MGVLFTKQKLNDYKHEKENLEQEHIFIGLVPEHRPLGTKLSFTVDPHSVNSSSQNHMEYVVIFCMASLVLCYDVITMYT